ncbi:hypothetical protein AVEN_18943-1 [Araneus ventricosus]|uniref:Uncharacterized protein n=1 Tax=Araneus ventricosus TaxID=182803 RepID=A0A4Y2IFQ8_ARAVE|nr:hypothetical protein AVEN_18943-1 [Araneus ventricosus]
MTFSTHFYTILRATNNSHEKCQGCTWKSSEKAIFSSVPSRSQRSRTKKQKGENGREYDSWEKETLVLSTVKNFPFTAMNAKLPRTREQRTGPTRLTLPQ